MHLSLNSLLKKKLFSFVGEKYLQSHKNVKRLREIVTATKMIKLVKVWFSKTNQLTG
jgi:hypothetical protein